jgi:peptide/nickel transport system permease protein
MIRNYKLGIKIGGGMLAMLMLAAIFAPLITAYHPLEINLAAELTAPNKEHWLGCDANGTDIFSILLFGARISLAVGLAATFFSVSIGLLAGSIAGYFGGRIDSIIGRILDIIFSFPGMILAIAIAAVLGPSIVNVILALSITGWAGYARLVRGEVKNLIEKEYIQAAIACGASHSRIIIRHIWPNLASPLAVAATFGLAGCILAEASLSFLGVGVPAGTASWGALLSAGKDVLIEAPHVPTFPGLAILITVISVNILGESLRICLDPKAN